MGAKHSKGKKDDLGDESQIDCVDKNSTLPASAKVGGLHKEEEVSAPELSKSGTLPANLSHSTSFSKRFRNSCRSWAKENGLVKEKKGAVNGSIDTSKEEPKENGVVVGKENGIAGDSLPDDIPDGKETKKQEVEEKEVKKGNVKVVQMRARAKFFEEMYNTPEKPKRVDLHTDSGMVTSTPIQPLSKVGALVKQVEDIESRNNSLDYEVNINDSIEQESDKILDSVKPNNEQKQDVEMPKEEDEVSAPVILQDEKINVSDPIEQVNTASVVDHEELESPKDETELKNEPNSSSLIVEVSELRIVDQPNKLEEVNTQYLEDEEKLSNNEPNNENTIEQSAIAENTTESINLIVEPATEKITDNLELVDLIEEEISDQDQEINEHENKELIIKSGLEDQVTKSSCDIEPVLTKIETSFVESSKEEIADTNEDDIKDSPQLKEPVINTDESSFVEGVQEKIGDTNEDKIIESPKLEEPVIINVESSYAESVKEDITDTNEDKIMEPAINNIEIIGCVKDEEEILHAKEEKIEDSLQQQESLIKSDISTEDIQSSYVEGVKEDIADTNDDKIMESPQLKEHVINNIEIIDCVKDEEEILPAKEEEIEDSSQQQESLIKSDISTEDIQSEKGSEGYVSNDLGSDDDDSERKEVVAKVVPTETVTETVRSEELEANNIQ